jgi:hypothetical protein
MKHPILSVCLALAIAASVGITYTKVYGPIAVPVAGLAAATTDPLKCHQEPWIGSISKTNGIPDPEQHVGTVISCVVQVDAVTLGNPEVNRGNCQIMGTSQPENGTYKFGETYKVGARCLSVLEFSLDENGQKQTHDLSE